MGRPDAEAPPQGRPVDPAEHGVCSHHSVHVFNVSCFFFVRCALRPASSILRRCFCVRCRAIRRIVRILSDSCRMLADVVVPVIWFSCLDFETPQCHSEHGRLRQDDQVRTSVGISCSRMAAGVQFRQPTFLFFSALANGGCSSPARHAPV